MLPVHRALCSVVHPGAIVQAETLVNATDAAVSHDGIRLAVGPVRPEFGEAGTSKSPRDERGRTTEMQAPRPLVCVALLDAIPIPNQLTECWWPEASKANGR